MLDNLYMKKYKINNGMHEPSIREIVLCCNDKKHDFGTEANSQLSKKEKLIIK